MNRIAVWARRMMCALIVALTLGASWPVPALAVSGSSTLADSGDQYVVTARSLNMRAGAGTEYLVIKHLRRGAVHRGRGDLADGLRAAFEGTARVEKAVGLRRERGACGKGCERRALY